MDEPKLGGTPARRAGAESALLAGFGELRPAERTLLDRCRDGEWALLGELPDGPEDSRRIRASFIRFLLLCGRDDVAVHEHGVALRGAWIDGVLDLAFANVERRLSLVNCRLEAVEAVHARAGFINLSGCRIEGPLAADGLRCAGFLFLRNGFRAERGVRLIGAEIGGDLDCSGGRFSTGPNGDALSCTRVSVAGRVTLKSYPGEPWTFEAAGPVRFDGASVEGDLDCTGGAFRAPAGTALSCVRAKVGGRLILESLKVCDGGVDLTLMEAGSLCDDAASWNGAAGRLALDGFAYKRFAGDAPTDAASRIAWLKRQNEAHLGDQFRPQPWEQAISVLRAMGHPNEARTVAVEMQEQLRSAGRVLDGTRPFHAFYGMAVGYGYKPLRLLLAAFAVWLVCGFAYWAAANPACFPWDAYLIGPPDPTKGPPADYRTFVPLVYSADVLLPVVDFGYQKAWQPVVPHGDRWSWGQLLLFLYWFEIAFGWVASLLLVGVLGSLVRKD